MQTLWHDVQHAARSLWRSTGFTAAAVATLALGIGATTAIVTVANATILAPPPYPDPDRLLVLATPDGGATGTQQELSFLRQRDGAVATTAAQRTTPGWTLIAGAHVEYVDGLEVTDRYFETFGVPLLMGREVLAREAAPGGERAVVLSEPVWRRAFAGHTNVLGEVITLGGRAHTVVGVAPATFRSNPPADVWTSLQIPARSNASNQTLFGRVAPGRTLVEALAELDATRADFQRSLDTPARARRIAFVTWMPYEAWMATGTRGLVMRVLLGAVACLLLLACVNTAGLQVARGIARSRDGAVRAALGATRLRLFREPLMESLLIAGLGAAMGLAIAAAVTRALTSWLSDDTKAGLLLGRDVHIDTRVLLITALVTLGCAVLSGLAPALGAVSSRSASSAGPARGGTTSRAGLRLRRSFATLQVGLAVVLLVGAGLLIRTFSTLRGVDLGFNPAAVVVGELAVQGDAGDPVARNTFIAQMVEQVRALPAVRHAAVSTSVPVDGGVNLAVRARGAATVTEPRAVDWTYVTGDYFPLLDIPVRAGRVFDERDAAGATPVAIVNEAFARQFYGRTNVVGETIETLGVGEPPRQIVGVVGDTKARSNAGWTRGMSALGAGNPPFLYVPSTQVSADVFRLVHSFTPMRLLVETRGPADVAPSVRQVVRRIDPTRPFVRFLSMDQIISRDLDLQRLLMVLVTTFSAIALALAVIGLYALVSFLAVQRTREVGIRMALGANSGRVFVEFLREGLTVGGVGLAVGLAGAMAVTRALTAFLVGVTPTDGATLVCVSGLLFVVATLATLIPARRAASLDPVRALRVD